MLVHRGIDHYASPVSNILLEVTPNCANICMNPVKLTPMCFLSLHCLVDVDRSECFDGGKLVFLADGDRWY